MCRFRFVTVSFLKAEMISICLFMDLYCVQQIDLRIKKEIVTRGSRFTSEISRFKEYFPRGNSGKTVPQETNLSCFRRRMVGCCQKFPARGPGMLADLHLEPAEVARTRSISFSLISSVSCFPRKGGPR